MEADEECWKDWLEGPACIMGAHPTVFHHQHAIGPATWNCYCGEVTKEAMTDIAEQEKH